MPVGVGREYGGVAHEDLPDALVALADGDYRVDDRPTLAVDAGETAVRALADVTLVTDEPARISEYAVETCGRDVDEVRADGIVVATPAGSHGYAADANGPLLSADAGALAVVPLAPFRVEGVQWVLDAPTAVTVVREEADVSLFVDGRDRGFAAPHAPVELDWGEPFPVAVVAASRGVGFE
nr:ATP-NAD kinase [Halobacterium noricense]